jgi:hypothetical protein
MSCAPDQFCVNPAVGCQPRAALGAVRNYRVRHGPDLRIEWLVRHAAARRTAVQHIRRLRERLHGYHERPADRRLPARDLPGRLKRRSFPSWLPRAQRRNEMSDVKTVRASFFAALAVAALGWG